MSTPGITPARSLRALGPILGLAAAWGFFAALTPANFLTLDNHALMLLQTTVVGVAAVGATLIIISGGIDLSVGSTIALSTVVVALLLKAGSGAALACAGGIATGALCGAAIGAIVTGRVLVVGAIVAAAATAWWAWPRWGPWPSLGAGALVAAFGAVAVVRVRRRLVLSPFIATLGAWGAIRGLSKGIADNQPVYPSDSGALGGLMNVSGGGLSGVLPPSVWILAAAAIATAGLLAYTVFGRRIFAIGGNEHAARICGVPIERTKMIIYAVGVSFAGLAGVLQFSYLSMGDPTTAGGYELKVIAAAVIGGASLSGGEGSVRGTLIGALLMTVVDNGCTKLGLDNWVQEIVTGAIIIGAVAIDRARHAGR